jgi:TolB-like protein
LPTETGSQERFESWKEIASYLKREVRTVQRWEKTAGLPVHRLQIDKSGGVYAFKSELDAWCRERQAVLERAPGAAGLFERAGVWVGAALVTALAVGLLLFFLSQARSSNARKQTKVNSLAVLPLENLTGDPSEEYFSDGMTDALITELAQLPGLRVISRTSTIHYKGTSETVPQIARELGVDAIVEGTVTRSNGRIRVSAQLIHAPSDTHLWAGSLTGSPQDTLKLQGEVAQGIASRISGHLSSVDRESISRPTTSNPEAYDDYLRGNYFLNKRTPDDTRTAIRYFQTAIARDARYAAPHAGMADAYFFLINTSELAPAEGYALSKRAAETALALDQNLDQAHVFLAVNAWQSEWNWSKGEAEYRRAIEINPNSAGHLGLSYLLSILGRSRESAEELTTAKALDPLSPQTFLVAILAPYYRRNYSEGLVQARAALELYPQNPLLHVALSNIYTLEGQDQLAEQEILLSEQYSGAAAQRIHSLEQANGLRSLRLKRIELNKRLASVPSPTNTYDLAVDYAAVGNKEQALRWLEAAFEARDPRITLIAVEPIFDHFRDDPRFQALVRQMGLPGTH